MWVCLTALLIFCADFIVFAVFEQWVSYGLLMFFVWQLTSYTKNEMANINMALVLILFLLQDVVVYDRFGVSLIYLLMLLLGGLQLKKILHLGDGTYFVMLFLGIIFVRLMLEILIFRSKLVVSSTILILCCNVIVAFFTLKLSKIFGICGNRSLR